jgi:hypothetical protein
MKPATAFDRSRISMSAFASKPCGVRVIDGELSAIELRRHLGWSLERFSSFCDRHIGRPGPSSVAEDIRIRDLMMDQISG